MPVSLQLHEENSISAGMRDISPHEIMVPTCLDGSVLTSHPMSV